MSFNVRRYLDIIKERGKPVLLSPEDFESEIAIAVMKDEFIGFHPDGHAIILGAHVQEPLHYHEAVKFIVEESNFSIATFSEMYNPDNISLFNNLILSNIYGYWFEQDLDRRWFKSNKIDLRTTDPYCLVLVRRITCKNQ